MGNHSVQKAACLGAGMLGCARAAGLTRAERARVQGLYCSPHRQPGMVNVKQKRCAAEGCTNRPSFNHQGEATGLYCSQHKLEGMVRAPGSRSGSGPRGVSV